MKTLITRYPAIKYLFFIAGISLCLCSCHSNEKAADDDNADGVDEEAADNEGDSDEALLGMEGDIVGVNEGE